ncbi:MAG: hypothetical protein CVV51_07740, partial [Spirochaetae bacterium HGW-Spirochaetae-7]
MKRRTRIVIIAAASLFAVLFAARFAYLLYFSGVRQSGEGGMPFQVNFEQSQGQDVSVRRNYASSKMLVAQPSAAPQLLEQKYERVARLSATSSSFDDDSSALDILAASMQALVQSENSWGLPGARTLSLSFGITPEKFESFVDGLKALGDLDSVTIVKTDKTAEYKELEARRLSLEKTRDGLRALRVPGASLSDLVALETKILEIEGQIQELGVSLGDFAEGNSFCTVHYSLRELKSAGIGPRILAALFGAMEWSLAVFIGIVVSV